MDLALIFRIPPMRANSLVLRRAKPLAAVNPVGDGNPNPVSAGI